MNENIQDEQYCCVTESKLYDKESFMEFGLFSEQIFGPLRDYTCQCGTMKQNGERCQICGVRYIKSEARDHTYSVIKLPFRIIAPQLFHILCKIDTTIAKELESYKLDIQKVYDLVDSIKSDSYDSTSQNVIIAKGIINQFPEYADMREILVIPPNLRPVSGSAKKYLADSINDSYQSILEQVNEYNNSVVKNNYHVMITQKIIYQNLYLTEIINKLSGKQGLIRQYMLGKRVDFSGRTVIVPDVTLPNDVIRLPYKIIAKIFEPYIINKYSNVIQAYNDLNKFNKSGELTSELKKIINQICINDKIPVLINRQPTLHRMSMRGYYPIPTESNSVHIPIIITDGFNADFDGDQMAIYAPLIAEEIEEYMTKFINHRNQIQHGVLKFMSITQFAYGVYIMTKDNPVEKPRVSINGNEPNSIIEELFFEKGYDYSESIKVILDENTEYITTFGRYFLSIYLDTLITYPLNKSKFNDIITKKLMRILDNRSLCYDDLKPVDNLLTKHLADISPTISLRTVCDIYQNKEFTNTLDKLRNTKSNSKYKEYEKELLGIVNNSPETENIMNIIKSGAKGGISSVKQLVISKGYVVDVMGNKVPHYINGSLVEGLSFKDMYVMSHGARKGSLDRSVNTASTGYLMRKIIFAIQDVEYDHSNEDCGAEPILNITLTEDNYYAYIYKWFIVAGSEDKELIKLTLDNYTEYLDKELIFRTHINCKSEKVCQKCYGHYNNIFNSKYVGIIGAQALGERVTQLTMRTFHTGGTVSDIREEIDPQYFSHVDDDYFNLTALEIEDIDDLEYEVGNELTHNIYITLEDGVELMIPKSAIMNVKIKPKSKITKGTKIFSLSGGASSVINLLDLVMTNIEHPDKNVKSWRELYDILFKAFYETEGIISTHLETLISNMLRNPDTNELARISPDGIDNYYILSIKKIPILRRILTMGYQGFHNNLLKSLATFKDNKESSILEKVILGVTKQSLGI